MDLKTCGVCQTLVESESSEAPHRGCVFSYHSDCITEEREDGALMKTYANSDCTSCRKQWDSLIGFKCPFCPAREVSLDTLAQHVRLTHPYGLYCTYCRPMKQCISEARLKRHIECVHQEYNEPKASIAMATILTSVGAKNSAAIECDKSFEVDKSDQCNKDSSLVKIQSFASPHTDRSVASPIPKIAKRKTLFQRCWDEGTRIALLPATAADKFDLQSVDESSGQDDMSRSFPSKPTLGQLYMCPICSAIKDDKEKLVAHLGYWHQDEIYCIICLPIKIFSTILMLDDHIYSCHGNVESEVVETGKTSACRVNELSKDATGAENQNAIASTNTTPNTKEAQADLRNNESPLTHSKKKSRRPASEDHMQIEPIHRRESEAHKAKLRRTMAGLLSSSESEEETTHYPVMGRNVPEPSRPSPERNKVRTINPMTMYTENVEQIPSTADTSLWIRDRIPASHTIISRVSSPQADEQAGTTHFSQWRFCSPPSQEYEFSENPQRDAFYEHGSQTLRLMFGDPSSEEINPVLPKKSYVPTVGTTEIMESPPSDINSSFTAIFETTNEGHIIAVPQALDDTYVPKQLGTATQARTEHEPLQKERMKGMLINLDIGQKRENEYKQDHNTNAAVSSKKMLNADPNALTNVQNSTIQGFPELSEAEFDKKFLLLDKHFDHSCNGPIGKHRMMISDASLASPFANKVAENIPTSTSSEGVRVNESDDMFPDAKYLLDLDKSLPSLPRLRKTNRDDCDIHRQRCNLPAHCHTCGSEHPFSAFPDFPEMSRKDFDWLFQRIGAKFSSSYNTSEPNEFCAGITPEVKNQPLEVLRGEESSILTTSIIEGVGNTKSPEESGAQGIHRSTERFSRPTAKSRRKRDVSPDKSPGPLDHLPIGEKIRVRYKSFTRKTSD